MGMSCEKREQAKEFQRRTVKSLSEKDPYISTVTEYYTVAGVDFPIDIYEPNKDKYSGKRPGIVFFFGGAFIIGTHKSFQWFAKACAEMGYVAFTPSYRLAVDYDVTPEDCIQDGCKAWEYIIDHAEKWQLDTSKLFLSGASAGGTIASMCGCVTKKFPAGLALFCPGILNENYGPEKLAEAIGTNACGMEIPNPNAVTKNMPPLLLIHGEDDKTVPLDNIRQYAKAYDAQDNSVKLVTYPETGHGFQNYNKDRAHFYLSLGELLLFLQKHSN